LLQDNKIASFQLQVLGSILNTTEQQTNAVHVIPNHSIIKFTKGLYSKKCQSRT